MELELNKVYNMDNMEGMAMIPDKYFDLAIVDPPYGIGEDGGSNHSRGGKAKPTLYTAKNWDKDPPNEDYFKELKRVSKNQIIWGANHFISRLPSFNSPCWVVWDKENGDNDFADCELAWSSFPSAVRRFKFRWAGMLQGNMKDKETRLHPTQKPVQLYKWLLQNYAKPGDKILDTHLGSGSSRIAAYDLGFDFLGFELDKEYYDKAEQRFKDHIRKPQLFTFDGKAKVEQTNIFNQKAA